MTTPLDHAAHQTAINTIRFLAVDMVEKAGSGHPGAPMGQAAMAYVLWTRHLRFNPKNPSWANRDRFVLSCGHASALLYSLLYLSGYDLSLQELKNFRQLHSKTPGHPEYGLTPGVETTTGPLGQGLGNAVGMAMAQSMLAAEFNREDFPIFDHLVWAFVSDGDLMEGVASEASSLSGHLGLGNLNVLYDDNEISIDGPTSLSFSENVLPRYESYGWHVLTVDDGNDLMALDAAIEAAKDQTDRPSLIAVRTHIGFGSPAKQDTAAAHGAPLGTDEVRATKEALGWPLDPTFHVPEKARAAFDQAGNHGAALESTWHELLERYRDKHPEVASELEVRLSDQLASNWEATLPSFSPEDGPLATRSASGKVLNSIATVLPQLTGGSADLTPSNNTYLQNSTDFSVANRKGRNLRFGVREHAMGAVLNGIALCKMLIPYGGTFLIFSDYMRPSIRLAALMGIPSIFVFTHDSIFLGEDGPTHQPISQLLSLRSIPGLTLIRPADANETVAAWRLAIGNRTGPTALALTRQKLPIFEETAELASDGVSRGAYILADSGDGQPDLILIATGSEVALALETAAVLEAEGTRVRVVSMPSWELFDAQENSYRIQVLPPSVTKRVAIEAGSPLGWERYVGLEGAVHGVDGFGASAPYRDIATAYGFTSGDVAQRARRLLS
ncbi:MAG: transketolase [Thermoanaerobaculia bacterium]